MSPLPYNRVKVNDLLNEEPGASVRRPGSSHSSSSELTCGIGKCTRRFKTNEALTAHQQRSHSADSEYVCPHCQSNFSTAPNLNKHIRSVHQKLKPFKCEQCSSTFSFRDALQRHTRMVHDQVRPFSCPYCSQKFKAKAHLTKHCSSIHSGQQPSSSFAAKKESRIRLVSNTYGCVKLCAFSIHGSGRKCEPWRWHRRQSCKQTSRDKNTCDCMTYLQSYSCGV